MKNGVIRKILSLLCGCYENGVVRKILFDLCFEEDIAASASYLSPVTPWAQKRLSFVVPWHTGLESILYNIWEAGQPIQ